MFCIKQGKGGKPITELKTNDIIYDILTYPHVHDGSLLILLYQYKYSGLSQQYYWNHLFCGALYVWDVIKVFVYTKI